MRVQIRLAALAVALTFMAAPAVRLAAQQPVQPVSQTADEKKYRPGRPDMSVAGGAEIVPVQGNVVLIATGRSANVVAQVGEMGVLLVDAGSAETSADVIAAIARTGKGPVKAIVSTTTDLDHIGGNARVAQTGQPLFLGAIGATTAPQAQVFASEKALMLVSAPTGQASAVPSALWPTDTYVGTKRKLHFNHEPIEVLAVPGHTGGDSIVWFRGSDVIAAGDIFSTLSYPKWDAARGGSFQGVLDGLNRLIDIAVPELNQQGGTRVVPAHGRIANQSDVVEYRDMVTIIRDRVRDAVTAGRTLDQIKAARYTLDYDGIYSVPDYTGDAFVEGLFKEVSASASPTKPVSPKLAAPKRAEPAKAGAKK